ncbi:MAG: hypothetical protein IT458_18200 [Planctomycetes bacterium]|nr:hypothetical protein [Planctomycetota bacterium]
MLRRLRAFVPLFLAAAPAAQEGIPLALRKPVETLAQDLAKVGLAREAMLAVDALVHLGLDPAAAGTLRTQLNHGAEKAARGRENGQKLAEQARRTARTLAAQLTRLGDLERLAAARAVLLLDAAVEEAQSVLGRRRVDGVFRDAAEEAMAARRQEVQVLMGAARNLEVPIEVGPSDHPLLTQILGGPGTQVRSGRLTLHTVWPPEKAARAVREGVRACSFAAWLRGAAQTVHTPRLTYVHVAVRPHYEAGLEWMAGQGQLRADQLPRLRQLAAAESAKGWRLELAPTEAVFDSVMVFHQEVLAISQPWLLAGQCEFVSRGMLGTSMPTVAWSDWSEKASAGRTSASGPELLERQEFFRLARAGLRGARTWLAYLAERGEDPAWSRCFVDAVGKIQGDDLLKAMSWVEYLHERQLFAPLLKAGGAQPAAFQGAVGKALEVPFEDADGVWREWLLRERGGVAQRLDAGKAALATPEEKAVLAHLQTIRDAALALRPVEADPPQQVGIDRGLAAGTLLHAAYLAANPEQAKAWPDAHEEYPDRKGFTVEGAWAGAHSVIAPGVRSMREAIDAWMATFYHRLPLTQPGLLRVGFGMVGGMAVLDADSLAIPTRDLKLLAVWPPANGKGIPTRFVPELPEPVPGVDQTTLGYPITVQFSSGLLKDQQIDLVLREGSDTGKPVEVYVSTPAHPTNPVLAPSDAWCLIPKAHLKPGTLYTVTATIPGHGPVTWSFRTGAR